MPDKHKCPANGCEQMLPFNILMCRSHWARVPQNIQNRVNTAWYKKQMDDYFQARREAIAIVNHKHGQPA